MKQKYINLFIKFKKIRDQEWIESKRKGPTGIGFTFETLLKIKENDLPIPDYEGIEIKTMRIKSKQEIHLFNATPDGDYLFCIEKILKKLGYPDKKHKTHNILFANVNCSEYTYIGYYKKIKLKIDREKEKLYLIAKDSNNKEIFNDISWSFNYLNEKINNKIKKLAIIKAYNKIENNKEYFYYSGIDFYEIKSFNTFIELIESGKISITFKIGTRINNENVIRNDNHGTSFSIRYKNIKELYNIVDIFKGPKV